MKRAVLFLCIGLIGGFLIHALLFPDLFSNGIFLLPEAPASITNQTQSQSSTTVPIDTIISYDGNHFSRTNVRIENSRYVTIINKSEDKQMDLVSTEESLSTPRPYAYMEQIHTRMDKPGTFIVADRTDPTIRLVITVK
jgi:hypothetical protein